MTPGQRIARDLCEMDAPTDDVIEVSPSDIAQRIDEELREYGARLVEKVATMTLSTYALKTIAAMIREGTFTCD